MGLIEIHRRTSKAQGSPRLRSSFFFSRCLKNRKRYSGTNPSEPNIWSMLAITLRLKTLGVGIPRALHRHDKEIGGVPISVRNNRDSMKDKVRERILAILITLNQRRL